MSSTNKWSSPPWPSVIKNKIILCSATFTVAFACLFSFFFQGYVVHVFPSQASQWSWWPCWCCSAGGKEGVGGKDRHESYVLHSSTQSLWVFSLTTDLVSKFMSQSELNIVREWVRETDKSCRKMTETAAPEVYTRAHTHTMTQTSKPSLILKQFHIWQLIHNKQQLGLLIIAQSPTGSSRGAKSLLPEGIMFSFSFPYQLDCVTGAGTHTPLGWAATNQSCRKYKSTEGRAGVAKGRNRLQRAAAAAAGAIVLPVCRCGLTVECSGYTSGALLRLICW